MINKSIYLKILRIDDKRTICFIDFKNKIAYPIRPEDIEYCFENGGANIRYCIDISEIVNTNIWKQTELIRLDKEIKNILKENKNDFTRRNKRNNK